VVGCWHGYLSGVRCRVAYGPADATATLRLVSYFSKIQTGFTFLVPAHHGSPEKRAVKRAGVCVCVVLCLCGISGIEAFLLAAQLRWVGHVVTMEDEWIPKEVFFGQLSSGKRQQCGPVRRYKDTVKTNMKSCGLRSQSLSTAPFDQAQWRTTCQSATASFEESQVAKLDRKRAACKQQVINITGTDWALHPLAYPSLT